MIPIDSAVVNKPTSPYSVPVVRRFRADIQGLRALAVLLVVLYHAGVPWLSGGYVGVDVFFVISGFLIGGHLLEELDNSGRIRLVQFYGRRLRRLLPASIVVVLATLVLVRIFTPPLGWNDVAIDGVFAALAGANLWFAATGTDYLANDAPSVYQHYWSLGLEEQFYIVFPLLVLGLYFLLRRNRKALILAIAVCAVLSFVLCIVVTGSNQPYSFFLLPTRAWELGAGVLIAATASSLGRMRESAAACAQWIGLFVIIIAVARFDHDTVFPGYWAALPVAGAALFLIGGIRDARLSPKLLMENSIAQFFGKISYSLYLWHWPLLVVPVLYSGSVLSGTEAAGLVVVAVVLSVVTEKYVETPCRQLDWLKKSEKRSYWSAFGVVLVTSLMCAAMSVMPALSTNAVAAEWNQRSAPQTMAPTMVVPRNLTPTLVNADDSVPAIYSNGCHGSVSATTPERGCVYGDQGSDRTIVLLGDSHAAQWFPALNTIALQRGYRLIPMTKSSCPASNVQVWNDALNRRYTECEEWRERTVAGIQELIPEIVVLGNFQGQKTLHRSDDSDEAFADGVADLISMLPAETDAVVLGDTPMHEVSPPICLSGALESAGECARTADGAVRDTWTSFNGQAARESGALFIDPLPWLCSDGACHAIYGNVLMYRDRHHITVEASERLSFALESALVGGGVLSGEVR